VQTARGDGCGTVDLRPGSSLPPVEADQASGIQVASA
jgi:hypothetical protein